MSLLAAERFQAFSGQHYALVTLTAIGAIVAVWFGRRYRGTRRERLVRRGAAAASLTFVLAMQVYWMTPDVRSAGNSWPLQLSDLADYTAVFALDPRAADFCLHLLRRAQFYLDGGAHPVAGPVLPGSALVRILGPTHLRGLGGDLPGLGLGFRPTWRLFRTTIVVVLGWAVVAYAFNVIMDTNYGYLVRTPAAATPLDWFGPWPWYLPGCRGTAADPVGCDLHAALGACETACDHRTRRPWATVDMKSVRRRVDAHVQTQRAT